MRKVIAATLLAATLAATPAIAGVRWAHYRQTNGNGPALIVKSKCLQGEDSAAHLKLTGFSSDRVTYGCSRRGY